MQFGQSRPHHLMVLYVIDKNSSLLPLDSIIGYGCGSMTKPKLCLEEILIFLVSSLPHPTHSPSHLCSLFIFFFPHHLVFVFLHIRTFRWQLFSVLVTKLVARDADSLGVLSDIGLSDIHDVSGYVFLSSFGIDKVDKGPGD